MTNKDGISVDEVRALKDRLGFRSDTLSRDAFDLIEAQERAYLALSERLKSLEHENAELREAIGRSAPM